MGQRVQPRRIDIDCEHEGTFDIRSGRAVDAPCTEPLHCYPVKVEQGVIYLRPVR
jgi:naphthalene 1,2-dioxygenase system ferredoxin subunit